MKRNDFINEINRIFKIALVQKAVQMVLRSAWIGGAVYILCWGTNRLWGWFPKQEWWIFASLLISAIWLVPIFFVRKPGSRFVWRLDRGFSLREQVYTLFEIFQTGDQEVEKQPLVHELLISDEISKVRDVRRELVDKGWRMKEEFEATVVVLILLMIVYLTSVSNITNIRTDGILNILPVNGSDPTADQVFSSGIPGYRVVEDTNGVVPSGMQVLGTEGDLNLTSIEWKQVSDLMKKLGSNLSKESGTYELGQALVEENYKVAANQFGILAENIDALSSNVQNRLADQFLDTAVGLQNYQQPEISNYFQEASAALFEGSTPKMYEKIDELAGLMELFSRIQSKDLKVDSDPDSAISIPQSFDQYQNNLLVIEEAENLLDYVSSPNYSGVEGEGVNGDNSDFIMPFDNKIIEGVWLPFQYFLEDSDVVSSYFSPR